MFEYFLKFITSCKDTLFFRFGGLWEKKREEIGVLAQIYSVYCMVIPDYCVILQQNQNNYTSMKSKNSRLDAIKIIISSKEIGSQEELLQELAKEGFTLTQATLSRDLKQLKVAKAASMNGNYVYVLPNNTMYKRMTEPVSAQEMLRYNGFVSIEFSGNLAVIKTRPGYASSLAYDIDNHNFDEIIGTIAGDDTLMLVLREGCTRTKVKNSLSLVIPNI